MVIKKYLLIIFNVICFSALAQNPLLSPGNLGIKTSNPIKSLQVGDFGSGGGDNQMLIPGQYNF